MPAATAMPQSATNHPQPKDRVLSTLNRDGSRRWLKPRPMPGRFLTARRFVAYGLILIFTLIPFLRMGGKPLILLDLGTRHFTFFGKTFLPTDTLLLALLLVGLFVTIFLLTALFGRVWCGWACPQTVYMEFLFRPIERLFEGIPGRASAGPLARIRALKYPVYLAVSLFLANTFLAYFVGVDRLVTWVTSSPLDHPTGFAVVAVTTGLMLFDFGFFREQLCIVACPYGRFQSVMLDRYSTIVGYDRARGEPRGKARGKAGGPSVSLPILADAPQQTVKPGDCVDCHMCVVTCPTGIDIREGLQMECVNCAQCIDACDSVMTKLGRPRGLIRYASQAELAGEPRRRLRPRVILYPIILFVVASAFAMVLGTQGPADITVLRGLGRPFTEMDGGLIGSQVRIKIVNRTESTASFTVAVAGIPGARIQPEEDLIVIPSGQSRTVPALITVPGSAFEHGACDVRLLITDGQGLDREVPYRMMGPGNHKNADDDEQEDKH